MKVRPVRIEWQDRLINAAFRVEIHVRVGCIRPARRHGLRPNCRAVVTLDDGIVQRRAVLDPVRPEVEVVEGRVFIEEELGAPDNRLGPRLDRQPRLGVVRVEWATTAIAGYPRVPNVW